MTLLNAFFIKKDIILIHYFWSYDSICVYIKLNLSQFIGFKNRDPKNTQLAITRYMSTNFLYTITLIPLVMLYNAILANILRYVHYDKNFEISSSYLSCRKAIEKL